jgi:anti-sigma regulatory factor (Ser/Thr protein kinase)
MRDQQAKKAPLQLRLQARPEFAPLLRERVRQWLEEAGATDREVFEVLLATTEAFANAVEHPHEPRSHLVDIEGTITDHAVSISIRDYGKWQGEQSHKEEGGMGVAMMERLMDAVRVECFVDGTTVTMQRHLAMH